MSRKKLVITSDITDTAAEHICNLVFGLLDTDKETAALIGDKFLARFIALSVHKTLDAPLPKELKSKNERIKRMQERLRMIKSRIQDSVAVGFQSAISQYTANGEVLEYYVQIKEMPEPVTKYSC